MSHAGDAGGDRCHTPGIWQACGLQPEGGGGAGEGGHQLRGTACLSCLCRHMPASYLWTVNGKPVLPTELAIQSMGQPCSSIVLQL